MFTQQDEDAKGVRGLLKCAVVTGNDESVDRIIRRIIHDLDPSNFPLGITVVMEIIRKAYSFRKKEWEFVFVPFHTLKHFPPCHTVHFY